MSKTFTTSRSCSPFGKRKKKEKMGSRKSSIKSTLKFHLSGSEDEQSLERIHTFNLKSEGKEFSNLIYDESPLKNLIKFKDLGPPIH